MGNTLEDTAVQLDTTADNQEGTIVRGTIDTAIVVGIVKQDNQEASADSQLRHQGNPEQPGIQELLDRLVQHSPKGRLASVELPVHSP